MLVLWIISDPHMPAISQMFHDTAVAYVAVLIGIPTAAFHVLVTVVAE